MVRRIEHLRGEAWQSYSQRRSTFATWWMTSRPQSVGIPITSVSLCCRVPRLHSRVTLGSLRLLLSGPKSSAGQAMADGERPGPGSWNRIHLIVDDLPVE